MSDDARTRSRGTICPGLASVITLEQWRAQGAPDAWSHPRLACKTKCHRYAEHRHSLRNGLRLIRGLPGAPGFLATVPPGQARGLIPASGDRDNTTSPSACNITRRLMPPASIASRAACRDDRDTPSLQARDMRIKATGLPDGTSVSPCDKVTRRAIGASPPCANCPSGESLALQAKASRLAFQAPSV